MSKYELVSVLLLCSAGTMMLPGCQTWGPTWSEVTGERYNVTILHRRPAGIEQIDGYSAYAAYPIKIEPGKHNLVIQGPAPGWRGPNLERFTLEVEPCKRYYINAQFENPIQPGFTPVIDYVEDIAGCQVKVASK
jgi:hypothetical protein